MNHDTHPSNSELTEPIVDPLERAKRSAVPLVKYAAVFLLGCGVVAGALASPLLVGAHKIEAQKSTIALKDTQLSKTKRDLKDQQLASAGCSYAADFFKQAADEYYAAGQATAQGMAHILDDYSAQLAAMRTHAGTAKNAYETAQSLDCKSSGLTVTPQ